VAQAPIRREANRLKTFNHIADDVRRKEGKVEHLLDAAFRSSCRPGDLGESLACLDHSVPSVGAGDVEEQDLVNGADDAVQNDLGFNAALAGPERRSDYEQVVSDPVRINVDAMR